MNWLIGRFKAWLYPDKGRELAAKAMEWYVTGEYR